MATCQQNITNSRSQYFTLTGKVLAQDNRYLERYRIPNLQK